MLIFEASTLIASGIKIFHTWAQVLIYTIYACQSSEQTRQYIAHQVTLNQHSLSAFYTELKGQLVPSHPGKAGQEKPPRCQDDTFGVSAFELCS